MLKQRNFFNYFLKTVLLLVIVFCLYSPNKLSAQSYGFDSPLLFDMYVAPSKHDWPMVSPHTTYPYGFHSIHDEITPVPYLWPYGPERFEVQNSLGLSQSQNRPVGVYLDHKTAPISGTENTVAFASIMNYQSEQGRRLDFVFMDFEFDFGTQDFAEVSEVIRQVRSHNDSNINQARIGQYEYFPGASNAARFYPGQTEWQANADSFYRSSGLNVAMPNMYAYSYYDTHTRWSVWGWNTCPNYRSALFWGPLENVSTPARELHNEPSLAGHLLIPYVGSFIHYDGYGSDTPPPHEDTEALLLHVRLRGADGYYMYRSLDTSWYDPALPEDTYGNENLKADMLDAWHELDWLFQDIEKEDVDIMNLTTDKNGGFEWSGVETPNGVAIIVSYLGNASGYWFDVPELAGYEDLLPDRVYVEAGTHEMITVQVPEPISVILLSFSASVLLLRRRG